MPAGATCGGSARSPRFVPPHLHRDPTAYPHTLCTGRTLADISPASTTGSRSPLTARDSLYRLDPVSSGRSPMDPQDARSLAMKLAELFKGIAPAEREVVETMLERFPSGTAETVISRYAQETATFDRGKLRTMLREEHARRTPRASPTPAWRDAKEAETKAIDELLDRIPKSRLRGLVEDVRKKHPTVFRLLQPDPLRTDVGRSLIYNELKNKQRQ